MNKVELYDRRADPADARNVAAEHPREVDRGMAQIAQWIEAQTRVRKLLGSGAKAALDQRTVERLRSLGYLGGKQ